MKNSRVQSSVEKRIEHFDEVGNLVSFTAGESANYEESRPRAKMVNSAFVPEFTSPCKMGCKCGIYYLCPRA